MPAAMANLRAILVLASVVVNLALEENVVPDHDSVTLLQGAVHEKSAKLSADDDVETPTQYNLPESSVCESGQAKSPLLPGTIKPEIHASALMEHMKAVRLTPEAESGDPPGATAFRVLLELMIVAVFVDGMRRWRLQQKETPSACRNPDASSVAAQKAEEAAEAAWIEMVTAASAADLPRFEKAMTRKPSVNRTDDWSCTPLHFAAAGGSASIAAALLKCGAEADARDASEETPLHFAARAGHSSICEQLLSSSANIDAVNAQDMTPLVVAGHANQEAVCRLLADHGAGVAGMSDEQLPPLVVSQFVRKVFAA